MTQNAIRKRQVPGLSWHSTDGKIFESATLVDSGGRSERVSL